MENLNKNNEKITYEYTSDEIQAMLNILNDLPSTFVVLKGMGWENNSLINQMFNILKKPLLQKQQELTRQKAQTINQNTK